ncbi:MAG TPA: septum formation initiator family protein [Acidobacteriota bacterium]|nr:septum formation initiator family protein [Acidobacteriota bacterium]HRR26716.1 septum formation initiator family protein [Acidobacteriota bacterium]HRV07640.1 septum formation initiator family protein [Acidobacteriota bacterium]
MSNRAQHHLWASLAFLSLTAFSTFLIFGRDGYLKLRTYRQQLAQLEAEGARLAGQNEELRRRIELLQSDPREIERLARERLELARPGDVVIHTP